MTLPCDPSPNNTGICKLMIINPMPDIKPVITEDGIFFTYSPSVLMPIKICNKPDKDIIKKTTSRFLSKYKYIEATTTVIGPVGPVICVGVPPNNAAKNPTIIAPYKPGNGPKPDATPNARAKGNATTAAVNPPKKSPRRLLILNP